MPRGVLSLIGGSHKNSEPCKYSYLFDGVNGDDRAAGGPSQREIYHINAQRIRGINVDNYFEVQSVQRLEIDESQSRKVECRTILDSNAVVSFVKTVAMNEE